MYTFCAMLIVCFFFNDTATTEIYTLSLHDALPMRTGAKTHGIAHEAVTASATEAAGAPGAPKTTRRPERLSTQHTRSRPSNRTPSDSISPCRRESVRPLSGARVSSADRAKAPPGAASAVA